MARTIGRKNRNLVKQLVIEELEKTKGKPWLPTPPRQTIEKIVIEKLPMELWDTWEGADSEIRRIIWDTVSEGHVGSAMKEVAGADDRRGKILKRCLRRAGYSGLISERAHEKSRGDNPAKKVSLICDACGRLVDKCYECGKEFHKGEAILCDYDWKTGGTVLVHLCAGCAGDRGTNAVVEEE